MGRETMKERLEVLSSSFHSEEELEIIKSVMDEMSQVRKDAEETNRHKDKFVSLVAHDLKSPLASVIGTLDILKDDLEEVLEPEQEQVFKIAQSSCELMTKMIEELLNLSKLKVGKIQLSKMFCNLHSLAGSVIDTLSFLANKKGIKIVNDIPSGAKALADFNLFFEVIQNLVSNAIKFCKEGDTITLYLPDEEGVTIAVSDTGVGISKEARGKLFMENEKTSTTGTAGERGTGLGLPFCYEIMKMHGGDLTIESEVGGGSIFFASLPFVKPILMLLDDQKMIRDMLKAQLNGKVDADIVEASNGKEALNMIKEKEPHLIIADVHMPEMGGFEFLEIIKHEHNLMHIPLIMATGDTEIETREKAFRLGANDFINKPVEDSDLIPRIKRFLI